MNATILMKWVVTVSLIAGAAVSQTAQEASEGEVSQSVKYRFAGGGQWRANRDGQATRPWRIHAVEREDGAVHAKLSMLGVPGLENVTIEGQIIGREAFGMLLDEKGAELVTFNATLAAKGAGGTFILGDGTSGTWEYDATTKAAVLTTEAELAAAGTE